MDGNGWRMTMLRIYIGTYELWEGWVEKVNLCVGVRGLRSPASWHGLRGLQNPENPIHRPMSTLFSFKTASGILRIILTKLLISGCSEIISILF